MVVGGEGGGVAAAADVSEVNAMTAMAVAFKKRFISNTVRGPGDALLGNTVKMVRILKPKAPRVCGLGLLGLFML